MCKTDKWINEDGISRKWSTSNKKKKTEQLCWLKQIGFLKSTDCIILFIQNSRKCKLLHSNRKQTNIFREVDWEGEVGRDMRAGGVNKGKGKKKLLGMGDMLIISTVVIISQVDTYVKISNFTL